MSIHVMLDLETAGSSADAAILTIGAVKFDAENFRVTDQFHQAIDPKTAYRYGGRFEPDTVLWWMSSKQDEARKMLMAKLNDAQDFEGVLHGFSDWFGPDSLPVWGNGATFDNVILRRAYERVGLPCPWNFWHDRCHRTVKSFAPDVKPSRRGLPEHDALADAKWQMLQLGDVCKKLRIKLT